MMFTRHTFLPLVLLIITFCKYVQNAQWGKTSVNASTLKIQPFKEAKEITPSKGSDEEQTPNDQEDKDKKITLLEEETNYPSTTTSSAGSATTATTSPSSTYNAPGCPDGWINGGYLGCFYFDSEEKRLNWVEAQIACEMLGGYLAEIKTHEENNFIESMAIIEESFTGVQSWWVGLSDMGHEGRWMWGHSVANAEFTSWGPGHPNTAPVNQDDCVAITLSEHFHWKDISCSETHHDSPSPICQRDVESVTTTKPTPSTTTFKDTTTASTFYVELRGSNAPGKGNVYAVNSKNELTSNIISTSHLMIAVVLKEQE